MANIGIPIIVAVIGAFAVIFGAVIAKVGWDRRPGSRNGRVWSGNGEHQQAQPMQQPITQVIWYQATETIQLVQLPVVQEPQPVPNRLRLT